MVFPEIFAVVTVSTVNMGTKQRFSLLLVDKDRKIRSLVQKMSVAGRVRQVVA